MDSQQQRDVRIGHIERQAAVDALGDHFADGRLDADEFSERSALAYAARTAGELRDLFRDLPSPENAQPAPMVRAPLPVMPPPLHAYPPPPPPAYAPYGHEPATGIPYSDRQKVIAGLLQIFLPFGIGRFYSGNVGVAVAQLITAFFGVGLLWCLIDGIVILAGRTVDQHGRPLR